MLMIDAFGEPFIQRYRYSGSSGVLDLETGMNAPLSARMALTAGGRTFVAGRTGAGTYEGAGSPLLKRSSRRAQGQSW